ncbi:hypothetical protein IC582_004037 [Cucumis melo]
MKKNNEINPICLYSYFTFPTSYLFESYGSHQDSLTNTIRHPNCVRTTTHCSSTTILDFGNIDRFFKIVLFLWAR